MRKGKGGEGLLDGGMAAAVGGLPLLLQQVLLISALSPGLLSLEPFAELSPQAKNEACLLGQCQPHVL